MKTINVKTLFGTAFLLSTLFSGAVIAAAADGEGEKWGELARVTPRKKIEALRRDYYSTAQQAFPSNLPYDPQLGGDVRVACWAKWKAMLDVTLDEFVVSLDQIDKRSIQEEELLRQRGENVSRLAGEFRKKVSQEKAQLEASLHRKLERSVNASFLPSQIVGKAPIERNWRILKAFDHGADAYHWEWKQMNQTTPTSYLLMQKVLIAMDVEVTEEMLREGLNPEDSKLCAARLAELKKQLEEISSKLPRVDHASAAAAARI